MTTAGLQLSTFVTYLRLSVPFYLPADQSHAISTVTHRREEKSLASVLQRETEIEEQQQKTRQAGGPSGD
jgi:hypothetical protein